MAPVGTVYVIDDDAAVRDWLVWWLEGAGLAVAAYASADEFLRAYDGQQPGCLVLDLRLPGASGIELLEHVTARGYPLATVVVTAYADVPTVIRVFRCGALDLLQKPFEKEELLACVREGLRRVNSARQQRDETENRRRKLEALSEREREVLGWVVAGRTSRAIGEELGIAEKTVEKHRLQIAVKLEVASLAEMVRVAVLGGVAPADTGLGEEGHWPRRRG